MNKPETTSRDDNYLETSISIDRYKCVSRKRASLEHPRASGPLNPGMDRNTF